MRRQHRLWLRWKSILRNKRKIFSRFLPTCGVITNEPCHARVALKIKPKLCLLLFHNKTHFLPKTQNCVFLFVESWCWCVTQFFRVIRLLARVVVASIIVCVYHLNTKFIRMYPSHRQPWLTLIWSLCAILNLGFVSACCF